MLSDQGGWHRKRVLQNLLMLRLMHSGGVSHVGSASGLQEDLGNLIDFIGQSERHLKPRTG